MLASLGASLARHENGETILAKGQKVDSYLFLLEGGVRAFMVQRGKEREVASIGAGESFAEAAPSLDFCPVNVSAVGRTLVLAVPAARLDGCNSDPAVRLKSNLRAKLAERVGTLARNIEVIGEPLLEDRILADLRTGTHDAQGWSNIPGGTQRSWASYLRVDEKVLSRKLREVRDAGTIELDGPRARALG